ncbi:MAG: bifunctional phosphoribosyl-AMP cyclohydrolase/phosphoribosyl-ATP diphosphatase HisIE [Lysobacter sp.]|nr:MAG: bifunctional phosphoribosyl-AMP cyclohydrolase/phosphoribosyl-ATP diphosphatase HisIE [Lysobacter sp.]
MNDTAKIAFDPATLDWEKQSGLLPAIVQHARSRKVLMLGYMSREALNTTLDRGEVTFYSRSKQRLWTKGERSGHTLRLIGIDTDCDRDTLLVQAQPQGPTCHLGRESCFPQAPGDGLAELEAVVAQRARERPVGSYTTRLFEAGMKRIAQKVGEEGLEVALAAVVEDDAALLGEAADLIYHLTVLLRARGLGMSDVERTLAARRA